MTVQLEYINHLSRFVQNIAYYAGIMVNAFSDRLCTKLCWHNQLVPNIDYCDNYSHDNRDMNFLLSPIPICSSLTCFRTISFDTLR